ncbi:hypothetical protein LCGC14_0699530 [marine sediment metagenome]|uniref:Uncharacterized protein n=1 Tax=marine sediment metagenome TaxID=412755 RepID=A0A0F9QIB4_9ZZZZ
MENIGGGILSPTFIIMERRDIRMDEKVDRHKDKLIRDISVEITVLFEKILDYAEVAVPNNDQYKKLRSKILRHGNNCIRNISKEINMRYDVKYEPTAETIIETRISKQVGI